MTIQTKTKIPLQLPGVHGQRVQALSAESVIFTLFSYCYTGRWLFLFPPSQGGALFCEHTAPSLKSDEIGGATPG